MAPVGRCHSLLHRRRIHAKSHTARRHGRRGAGGQRFSRPRRVAPTPPLAEPASWVVLPSRGAALSSGRHCLQVFHPSARPQWRTLPTTSHWSEPRTHARWPPGSFAWRAAARPVGSSPARPKCEKQTAAPYWASWRGTICKSHNHTHPCDALAQPCDDRHSTARVCLSRRPHAVVHTRGQEARAKRLVVCSRITASWSPASPVGLCCFVAGVLRERRGRCRARRRSYSRVPKPRRSI